MNDISDTSASTAEVRRAHFEAMWAEHHARISGYVLRRAPTAEEAADVVAETFLVAWRRLDDAPRGETHLWLYAVARRVLANHRRGTRRRTQLAERLRHEWAEREPITRDPAQSFPELAVAFRSLADADREVLALHAWEQLGTAEIAAVLGCSRNAVRIRLHRARRRLHAALGEPEEMAGGRSVASRQADRSVPNGEIA